MVPILLLPFFFSTLLFFIFYSSPYKLICPRMIHIFDKRERILCLGLKWNELSKNKYFSFYICISVLATKLDFCRPSGKKINIGPKNKTAFTQKLLGRLLDPRLSKPVKEDNQSSSPQALKPTQTQNGET